MRPAWRSSYAFDLPFSLYCRADILPIQPAWHSGYVAGQTTRDGHLSHRTKKCRRKYNCPLAIRLHCRRSATRSPSCMSIMKYTMLNFGSTLLWRLGRRLRRWPTLKTTLRLCVSSVRRIEKITPYILMLYRPAHPANVDIWTQNVFQPLYRSRYMSLIREFYIRFLPFSMINYSCMQGFIHIILSEDMHIIFEYSFYIS